MKRNSLSIVMFVLFFFTWAGQTYTGLKTLNEDLQLHGKKAVSISEYLHSGHFWESTFENWESEFLQMALFVILTSFLFQKGSSESNPLPEEKQSQKKYPRRYFVGRPLLRKLYENSLSLVLFLLFFISFIGHLIGGWKEENMKRMMAPFPMAPESLVDFFTSSEFWFQSLQNWQSEFLSVGMIVVLSIFLRQKGSSQSKDVDAPHSETKY